MICEDPNPEPQTERERVLSLLQRHGEHATSFQILESGYSYWFDPEVPGVIAFVDAGRHRVVAGVPVTAPEHVGPVVARFVAACQAEGRRALFFSADAAFVERLEASEEAPRFDGIVIGEQADFDPGAYSLAGSERRSLRSQVRRAERKVSVRCLTPDELREPGSPARQRMLEVLSTWKASRRMSVMGFLVEVELFRFCDERRYYVAERDEDGRMEAFLVAVPVYGKDGWFLEDVIRRPSAPNGTSELLIHTAIEEAAANGDGYVTLGLSPLTGVPRGPGPHRLLRAGFGICERELGYLYGFRSLRRFKNRFRPDAWSPQYVVVSPPNVGLGAIAAVLKVFAGQSLLAFGLDTARRLLPAVPRWFYLVLVAWLVLVSAGMWWGWQMLPT